MVERELAVENLDGEPPLQKELTWGLSYRTMKEGDESGPIRQKHSPISIPFKLCRLAQKSHRKRKSMCKCTLTSFQTQQIRTNQISLLDRNALSQERYMDLLSMPNQSYAPKKKRRKKRKPKPCCKCLIEPCPPRLIQMSIPNKRYVLNNWKAFQHFLPAEVLTRFDQILKSGDNLEPRVARYYFKQLQKKKLKEIRRRKRRQKKRKEAMRRGDMAWLLNEIEQTAESIVNYIKNEPLFMLNFQQMATSDELLRYLGSQRVVKIKSRNTKCVYKKTVIEISDKLVKWMDTMSFFADIQPISSKERILEIPSLESLLEEEILEEEEGEEFGEEEELEERLRRLRGEEEWGEGEGEEGLMGEEGAGDRGLEQFMAEKLLDRKGLFGEDQDEVGFLDLLRDLDEDILEKLIKILSASPDDFLMEEVDPQFLPGITYGDILQKLKEIRDGNLLERKRDTMFLEEKMIEWAKHNDPESVDDKILDKIHETAKILEEWFRSSDLSEFRDKKGIGRPGEYDEWGEDELDETLKPIIEEFEKEEEQRGALGLGATDEERRLRDQLGMMGEDYMEDEDEFGEYKGDRLAELGLLMDEYGEGFESDFGEGYGLGAGFGEGAAFGREAGKEGFREGEGLEGSEGFEETGVFREGEGFELGEEYGEGEGEGGEGEEREGEEGLGLEAEAERLVDRADAELERLDSLMGIIRGHKPSVVFEHEPGTICCLSLKIWAVWLLEIANNAHNWTKWIADIISQVRHYASVIRGDVREPSGETKVLYKEEWRKFVKDTEEKIVSWRSYSQHVKDLSNEIMENFHGKKVNCCPKCLQDHLIKNVVTAHETFQALTEAINCAGYWQRALDRIVETTKKITELDVTTPKGGSEASLAESEESYTIEIVELTGMPYAPSEASISSFYEIEELPVPRGVSSEIEIEEVQPVRFMPPMREITEFQLCTPRKTDQPASAKGGGKHEPKPHAKPKKSNIKKR